MKTNEIRSVFLEYFRQNDHEIVASSSLVPHDDPTLLFTNAGMNQFKDVFLGREQRGYTRAATSQKCVRAGGKHNDLDNVGYTARHHTFFEMLGNFSFGDYFKKDAIKLAWDFLTVTLKLPKERLCMTVYDSDDETYDIWLKDIGIPEKDIIRIGDNQGAPYASDNFWQMGDTGPCGPCTEIFYDHGDHIWGGRPGTSEEDGDRFIEIWNIVFMQYNRQLDGEMQLLPRPSVDTGMGLERISAVMQQVHNNYDIDLFRSLLNMASEILGGVAVTESSLRVIADHIRSCSFLISDGVIPSNEGRGYTLRRIIRRACRHGHKLGSQDAFLHKLVVPLIDVMGEAYPELVTHQTKIERALLLEEEQFTRTLDKGMKILEESIVSLNGNVISGQTVFNLYDTYGFPPDMTYDIVRERGLKVDMDGFEKALDAQRERARQSGKFNIDYNEQLIVEGKTAFIGYDETSVHACVGSMFMEGKRVEVIGEGQQAIVILDQTPFYAESGGQVGDTGVLDFSTGSAFVTDTRKNGEQHLHIVEVASGLLKTGEEVFALIDSDKRHAISLNHSATHLLHATLRHVLGDHVVQKGSLVEADRLRFDFSHHERLKPEEIVTIERIVNQHIRANTPVQVERMNINAAKAKGAMSLFGDKYDDEVRVLTMGIDNFSIELCGGVHASRTGDIGSFRILSETGIASGVRRIEAVTGVLAEEFVQERLADLNDLCRIIKAKPNNLVLKLQAIVDKNKELEKEHQRLKQMLANAGSHDLMTQVIEVKGIKLLATELVDVDPKSMRDMVDQLKNKIGTGIVVLTTQNEGRVPLAAGVTQDLTHRVKAGDLLRIVADQLGGKGGGRPDFAQGSGTQPENIKKALSCVKLWLEKNL